MGKRQVLLGGLVALAFLAGWWVGHSSNAERAPLTEAECMAAATAAEPERVAPSPPGPGIIESAPAEPTGLDVLDALADVVAGLWRRDPLQIVDAVTDTMSDRELESALTTLTDLKSEDLDDVGDLRAFSRRLSRIAAEGLLTDLEDTSLEGIDELELFEPDAESPGVVFGSSQYKIVGEYRVREDGPRRVLIKWIREEPYELLQLRRRSIDPASDLLVVNGIQPGGWSTGRYRVQIFALNDAVDLLAEGRFRIIEDRDPNGSATPHLR
jgi:hypothetical protein